MRALLDGAPDADLVLVTHEGFEALRQVGDALDGVPLPEPIRVQVTRIERAAIPAGQDFARWMDDRWEEADRRSVEAGAPSAARERGTG